MGKIRIKKVSPKDVGKVFQKAAKDIGGNIVKSAKGIAAAGKALGKCKVGDVKCAAKGLTGIATSVGKMAVAVSPGGVALTAADSASGGKIKKGLTSFTTSVIGVNPNDLASGDPTKMAKALGKAAYQVSGMKQAVDAGKALAKCKPNDSACIAKNLAQLAAVAASYVPGAGGAAKVAMTLGKNAVKAAVKAEVEKAVKKSDAFKKLKEKKDAGAPPHEIAAAQAEADQASKELDDAMKTKAAEEKKLQDATIVLASQTAAEVAQKEIDKAKASDNATMKQAALGAESKIADAQASALAQKKPEDPKKKSSKVLTLIMIVLMFLLFFTLFIL
jgi:hypothetical protein